MRCEEIANEKYAAFVANKVHCFHVSLVDVFLEIFKLTVFKMLHTGLVRIREYCEV